MTSMLHKSRVMTVMITGKVKSVTAKYRPMPAKAMIMKIAETVMQKTLNQLSGQQIQTKFVYAISVMSSVQRVVNSVGVRVFVLS